MKTENLAFPPDLIKLHSTEKINDRISYRYRIDLDDRSLFSTEVFQEGTGHKWVTEHFCKTIEDAIAVIETNYSNVSCETDSLFHNIEQLGDKGLPWVTIPSPIMTVCRMFDPQDFLLYSALHQKNVEKLMEKIYERTCETLVKLLKMGAGPIIRFGGAEHATPPMMSPHDFDRLVIAYDKPLMDTCHDNKCLVAVHCHGNIGYAVKRFTEIGVDQIDPVEATPWGDTTIEEIREITKDRITLTGNIQFSEICDSSCDDIKGRVNDLISKAGPKRLIISTTGTPPEKITKKQFDNYNAMIDAVIEYRI